MQLKMRLILCTCMWYHWSRTPNLEIANSGQLNHFANPGQLNNFANPDQRNNANVCDSMNAAITYNNYNINHTTKIIQQQLNNNNRSSQGIAYITIVTNK